MAINCALQLSYGVSSLQASCSASGVIPFLKNEIFDEYYTLLGFGFVFGYFSDNILAALLNLAAKLFGTLHGLLRSPMVLLEGNLSDNSFPSFEDTCVRYGAKAAGLCFLPLEMAVTFLLRVG